MLGETIRKRIRVQVRKAAMTQVHEKMMERVKKQYRGVSESSFSCIPYGASPWSVDYTGCTKQYPEHYNGGQMRNQKR